MNVSELLELISRITVVLSPLLLLGEGIEAVDFPDMFSIPSSNTEQQIVRSSKSGADLGSCEWESQSLGPWMKLQVALPSTNLVDIRVPQRPLADVNKLQRLFP